MRAPRASRACHEERRWGREGRETMTGGSQVAPKDTSATYATLQRREPRATDDIPSSDAQATVPYGLSRHQRPPTPSVGRARAITPAHFALRPAYWLFPSHDPRSPVTTPVMRDRSRPGAPSPVTRRLEWALSHTVGRQHTCLLPSNSPAPDLGFRGPLPSSAPLCLRNPRRERAKLQISEYWSRHTSLRPRGSARHYSPSPTPNHER